MKSPVRLFAVALLLASSFLLPGCSTDTVQDARASGLENRQDRIDSRSSARQERWKTRGEREDARSRAAFEAM